MNAVRIVAVACCALSVSCAAKAPTRVQYLLRAEPSPRSVRVEAPIHVGLGSVTIAPYLRQPGLVVATEDGQVRAANGHLWAEPLDAGLRSYLRAEISDKLGYDISASGVDRSGWDYTIDVYVDRLHGTMSGTAILDASYQITPRAGAKKVADYRFSHAAGLPREGYSGLVSAETHLVAELAAAIVGSLRALHDS